MLLATAQTAYRRNAALVKKAERSVLAKRTTRDRAVEIGRHQMLAATLAVRTSAAVLAEQGVDTDGPRVITPAFTAGLTTLEELVDGANATSLVLLTQVLVGDAGKSAGGVYTASRPQQLGYVRYLVGTSCERCAILAGRWYRWSDGFLRHPFCDCVHLPANRSASEELAADPMTAFEEGRITGLSKAQTAAIRDGADISQVVNARRGMRMVNFGGRRVQTTTTNARGRVRLTPESIYRLSRDRSEAIGLLRVYGYIR